MNSALLDMALIAWDEGLRITHAEGACAHVLGRGVDSLLGLELGHLLPGSPAKLQQWDQLARSGEGVEFVRIAAPPERWLRLHLGQWRGFPGAGVVDLSHLLMGAPPLQISRLSSSLSHEIRNPLSSVKMAVQTMARNTGLSERDQRRLVIANREIRTMERMLWLFSEYGRDSLPTLEPLPLRTVIAEAAALVEPELAERQVRVRVSEPTSNPARVPADSSRLRPVLAQLLLNVAMGLPPQAEVEVHIAEGPEGCVLRLADPTATFPADEQHTLFQPFGSMLARGAGLSLATLARVMAGHNGSVRAEPGNPGTLYILTFPLN